MPISFATSLKVVIEGEATAAQGWAVVADALASGGMAIQAQTASAQPLAFTFALPAAGTYYLDLRAELSGVLGTNDGFAVLLDGKALVIPAADRFDLAYHWNGSAQGEAPIRLDVTTTGSHTITIVPAAVGLRLDAIAITTSATTRPGMTLPHAADDFLGSLGVCTHLNYFDTVYGDFAKVQSALAYLGLHNIRDGITQQTELLSRLDTLGAAGIKLDAVIHTADPVDFQLQAAAARASMMGSIEGPNETDYFPISYAGLTGVAATQALMQDIHTYVKATPALQGVPVLQTTAAFPNYFAQLGNLSALADATTTHTYFGSGQGPETAIDQNILNAQAISGAGPVYTTETGYYSMPDGTNGVDETVQAKYTARILLEDFARGVTRSFLYELFDEFPDAANANSEMHFGLFRNDGTAKPAAAAVHNLTSMLAGTGSATLQPLGYALSGVPASAHDLLLERADGTYMLALWNEVNSWDPVARKPLANAGVPITVDMPYAFATVKIHDVVTGAVTQATLTDPTHISVMLTDSPIVIELAQTPPLTTPAAGLVLGSGARTLALRLSEDAYLGDAQFTVAVDGVKLGGTMVTSASHAAGKVDLLSLRGDWAAGSHTVSVSFLNDAYGGSPAQDRNLHLDGISLDGKALAGTAFALNSMETHDFAVTVPSAPMPAAGLVLGTGAHSLTLRVSEDAYAGDAQFTVAADGVTLGGRMVTTASHAAGKVDLLTMRGDWTAGSHIISVNFLNDAYGGSPAQDRNLHVDGMSLDGTAIAGTAFALNSTETHDFHYSL